MAATRYRLAIDFGTSSTVAYLALADRPAKPLLFDGSPALASAVCADGAGGLLVGADALQAGRAHPERLEPHPKSRIDDGTVLLGAGEYAVTEVIGAVLGRVRGVAEEIAGAPVGTATLTHPAAWAAPRQAVLAAAATRAGLSTVELLPEPVAAARHYLHLAAGTLPVGSAALVYDLGAGTCDASVIRAEAGGLAVAAAEGLDQLGGRDLDAALVGHLGGVLARRDPQRWQRLDQPTAPADSRARQALWQDVRAARESLTRLSAVTLHVPVFDVEVPLGREEFEELVRPLVEQTVALARRALRLADVGERGLSAVFLVGGASRTPLVATLLHRRLGVAPNVLEQPELAVAEGALRAVPPTVPGPAAPGSAARLAPVPAAPPLVAKKERPAPPHSPWPPPSTPPRAPASGVPAPATPAAASGAVQPVAGSRPGRARVVPTGRDGRGRKRPVPNGRDRSRGGSSDAIFVAIGLGFAVLLLTSMCHMGGSGSGSHPGPTGSAASSSAAASVRVHNGDPVATLPCTPRSCAHYVAVELAGFPAGTAFTCTFDAPHEHAFRSFSGNTSADGTFAGQTGASYQYDGGWLAATCDGITGRDENW